MVLTNMGHQWTHDGDRAMCLFCECSPLGSAAKSRCPEVKASVQAEAAVRRLAKSREAQMLATREEPLPQPEDE